jgi:hypothetical protein
MAHRFSEAGGALDGDVVALRGTGRQHDFAGIGAKERRDMGAGVFDGLFGGLTHNVFGAVRVAVFLGEVRQHRGHHARVAAGGGLIVQIDRAIWAGRHHVH